MCNLLIYKINLLSHVPTIQINQIYVTHFVEKKNLRKKEKQ